MNVPSSIRSIGPGRYRTGLIPVLLFLVAAGCGSSQTRPIPPDELPFVALDASREELLASLQAQSGRVRTIRATVQYVASGDIVGDGGGVSERTYDPIRGGLVVQWPDLVRMNGNTTLGLVSAFDMSSNGEEFRLSVPARGRFYYGPNDGKIEGADDNPLLHLRPHHVLQALFVDVRGYLDDPSIVRSFAAISEGRRNFYVFSFIDASSPEGKLLERIWIDRRNLQISRKQLFGEGGVLELQADYDQHRDIDGVSFPGRVAIEKPVEGASLEVDFLEAELNSEIAESLFVLNYPPGAESIRVGDPVSGPDNADVQAVGSRGAGSANAVN